jgi:uncharacterized repeat protein (TIGR03803 family)
MPAKTPLFIIVTALALSCGLLSIVTPAAAQGSETVIYSFCDNSPACPDGAFPYAGLTMDASGNVYGTTYGGGGGMGCNGSGCGSVFRLRPSAVTTTGMWGEKVLHGFLSFLSDGFYPESAVTLDHAGNIYGTTWAGGLASSGCNIYGCGTVFKLTPNADDEWAETIIYDFCAKASCTDGAGPVAGLIFDAAGNLYGATATGGTVDQRCAYGCGTIFELSPGAKGSWTEKVLYRFSYAEGANPLASLVFDSAGNLYGTTAQGGTNGIGTVFKLAPGANGTWTETTLHIFDTTDGRVPQSSLIIDKAGNLYGTTFLGGTGAGCLYSYGCGTVFEVSPGSNGTWTEQVLHNFCAAAFCADGSNPWGGLVADGNGVLYGTTYEGGENNVGILFRLTFNTTWSESLVYTFGSIYYDAWNSQAGLIVDAHGNLYGTGEYGGLSTNCNNFQSCGAVFRFDPGIAAKPNVDHGLNGTP